ncbi:restriction endonuclease subunit S [Methylomonas koyamae]|uniref:restriction endonuclease subunit S n=1 Tax=Methylomonas koyamae TaxID=702114 RepID=UPI0028737A02|nr:restriction endonuclease subunit S [Methylomonas koyamae]WNB73983.1 restriction endonuclease subunit S [Methylomonas koyamae]
MMGTVRYPSYRDSGLPWVPEIPEGWQVLRNGRLFAHRVQTGFPDLPILEVSLRTGVRVRDMENLKRKQVMSQKEKYKRAAKGDIAYNMMRMWQGALGAAPVDGLVSPAYVVASPFPEVNSAYFSYLFRTAAYMREVNKFSRGIVSDRNRLYWDEFKQMPSLLPPRVEQDQIVAYLRVQDAHIARFIKAKRDLISLLNEQKLRIIDHAVMRGLDTSVALKPSGIEWLGDIPEHWDISRLGSCIKTSRAGIWGSEPSERNLADQLICVRVADFDMERLAVDIGKLTVRAVTPSDRSGRLLCPGDILLEKSGGGDKTPVGRVVAFTLDEASVCSNFVARLVPNTQIVRPAFLLTLMNHLHARRIVIPYIKQTTGIQNLDSMAYFKLGVALPSLDEQDKIVYALEEQCKSLNDAINRAKDEIKLIHEYRDRLIADIVTGQIDVRDWVPGPDDVVAEEDLAALGGDEDIEADGGEDDGEE